ncbi:MAG: hypothetical protein FJZ58_02730 [Chlamydiae bacterium]|nr:hypothetical protein [Chlamydiota bacterium]
MQISCCFSGCYQWEQLPRGKSTEFVFQDTLSGRVYGAAEKDSLGCIRCKLFLLFLGAIPLTAARLIGRVVVLVQGDFIRAGYRNAELELLLQEQTLDDVTFVYSKHVVWQLAQNIVQIVTLPLAMVAIMGSALYGLFDPLTGRAFLGAIEDLWSRDNIAFEGSGCECFFLDYFAPCMQPKDVADRNNLYRFSNKYKPDDIRSIHRTVEQEFLRKQPLFTRKGIKDPSERLRTDHQTFTSIREDLQDILKEHDNQLKILQITGGNLSSLGKELEKLQQTLQQASPRNTPLEKSLLAIQLRIEELSKQTEQLKKTLSCVSNDIDEKTIQEINQLLS